MYRTKQDKTGNLWDMVFVDHTPFNFSSHLSVTIISCSKGKNKSADKLQPAPLWYKAPNVHTIQINEIEKMLRLLVAAGVVPIFFTYMWLYVAPQTNTHAKAVGLVLRLDYLL